MALGSEWITGCKSLVGAGYAIARKCDLDFEPGNFISSGGKLRKVEARLRSGSQGTVEISSLHVKGSFDRVVRRGWKPPTPRCERVDCSNICACKESRVVIGYQTQGGLSLCNGWLGRIHWVSKCWVKRGRRHWCWIFCDVFGVDEEILGSCDGCLRNIE